MTCSCQEAKNTERIGTILKRVAGTELAIIQDQNFMKKKKRSGCHTTSDAVCIEKRKGKDSDSVRPNTPQNAGWGVLTNNTHFADRHGDSLEVWEPHNLNPRYLN